MKKRAEYQRDWFYPYLYVLGRSAKVVRLNSLFDLGSMAMPELDTLDGEWGLFLNYVSMVHRVPYRLNGNRLQLLPGFTEDGSRILLDYVVMDSVVYLLRLDLNSGRRSVGTYRADGKVTWRMVRETVERFALDAQASEPLVVEVTQPEGHWRILRFSEVSH